MHCPEIAWKELALIFEPGISVPELGGENETAERFGAACVDQGWGCPGGAGKDRWF